MNMLHFLLLITSIVAAADQSHRRRKSTLPAPPPVASYSEVVSVYTSLTLVPMNPQYTLPYQPPYTDTQMVNQGGLQQATVTNTIFIQAATVTVTVTSVVTQAITILAAGPSLAQCVGASQQAAPQQAAPQQAAPQQAASSQLAPQVAPQPATSQLPTAPGYSSSPGGSVDTGQDQDDSDQTTTSDDDDGDDSTSVHLPVKTSSSIYLPYVTTKKHRGFF